MRPFKKGDRVWVPDLQGNSRGTVIETYRLQDNVWSVFFPKPGEGKQRIVVELDRRGYWSGPAEQACRFKRVRRSESSPAPALSR